MPSWYNLFFAVFGTAAVLRHLETNNRTWLVVAGVCAGASCLAKIVGLYLVAAVLFFLAFREQFLSRVTPDRLGSVPPTRLGTYARFALYFLLLFLTLLVVLVFDELGIREFIHFVLPAVVLAVLYVWNERAWPTKPSPERFATLTRLVVPFLLGLSMPLAVFLLPYVASGSVAALGHGVFVQSLTQLTFAHVRPPSLLATTVATIPLVVVLASSFWRYRVGWMAITVAALAVGSILSAAATEALLYRLVWYSVRALIPVTTVAGVVMLMWSNTAAPLSALRSQQVLVLLCVMAMVSVVQFPFSTPIYFLYVAPIIAFTAPAVMSVVRVSHFVPVAVLCFYLLFAVLWVNGSGVDTIGFYYVPDDQTELLDLDRGGLRVRSEEKDEYERLMAVLQARARSDFIYATPDCPEVYFLSGLRNPTRTFFDYYDDPVGRTVRILDAIEQHQVRLVVLNREPSFSGDVPPELTASLTAWFPYAMEVGRFHVRWRE